MPTRYSARVWVWRASAPSCCGASQTGPSRVAAARPTGGPRGWAHSVTLIRMERTSPTTPRRACPPRRGSRHSSRGSVAGACRPGAEAAAVGRASTTCHLTMTRCRRAGGGGDLPSRQTAAAFFREGRPALLRSDAHCGAAFAPEATAAPAAAAARGARGIAPAERGGIREEPIDRSATETWPHASASATRPIRAWVVRTRPPLPWASGAAAHRRPCTSVLDK